MPLQIINQKISQNPTTQGFATYFRWLNCRTKVIRKATKRRKLFPNDDSALKVVFLAINAASKKWTMPIKNWKKALNRFSIEYGERITQYL